MAVELALDSYTLGCPQTQCGIQFLTIALLVSIENFVFKEHFIGVGVELLLVEFREEVVL